METIATEAAESAAKGPPKESYWRLFLRFLRFGCLAWGGPVAQIDMIRQELVTEERWVTRERFKKLLGMYQVLPGPEAHELCVYFGMLARGRIGGILAGLGFMLPGFLLMFFLSWLYVAYHITETPMQAVFLGIQPAVIALIFRAAHRIGTHVLTDRPLVVIAVVSAVVDLLGVPFWMTLPVAGAAYLFAVQKRWTVAVLLGVLFLGAAVMVAPENTRFKTSRENGRIEKVRRNEQTPRPEMPSQKNGIEVSQGQMFVSGLRAGLLTFGGAYTAIPFLQRDAVEQGKWMSDGEFLDGVAMSGTLPAPLIIFSTFVGYIGGGAVGALLMTIGVFLPAFGFSLLFHNQLERLMERAVLCEVLEGVTAGVVGIIASTLITLGAGTITNLKAAVIFGLALIPLYFWRSKAVIPCVVIAAGVLGWFLFRSTL
jgi:chromate transporter